MAYKEGLCRNPDPKGFNWWVNQCEGGRKNTDTVQNLIFSFRWGPEYKRKLQEGVLIDNRDEVATLRDAITICVEHPHWNTVEWNVEQHALSDFPGAMKAEDRMDDDAWLQWYSCLKPNKRDQW